MEYKLIPSRFSSCLPWKIDSNLKIIFKLGDFKDKGLIEVKTVTASEHAQYTDYHSLIPSILKIGNTDPHKNLPTAEILDLVSKGLATFDNMFIFHTNFKPNDNQVTNSVYSSYEMLKHLFFEESDKDKYIYIVNFVTNILYFLEDIKDVSTSCYLYILMIRTLYLIIVYGAVPSDIYKYFKSSFIRSKSLNLIEKLFSNESDLEENVNFLTLRLYQCIVLIQSKYIEYIRNPRSDDFTELKKVFKEFKLLHGKLHIENCKQYLPRHILTNDDEEVPHLDILYDYISSLLQEHIENSENIPKLLIEKKPEATSYFSMAFILGTGFKENVYINVQNPPRQGTSKIILDYMTNFYYHVYKGTFTGLSPEFVRDKILYNADHYKDHDSAVYLLLNGNTEKAFKNLYTSSFDAVVDVKIFHSNYTPLLRLQYDLVKLFQRNKEMVIKPEVLQKFQSYDSEDNSKALKIVLESKVLKYVFSTEKKVIYFDTSGKYNYVKLVEVEKPIVYDESNKIVEDFVVYKLKNENPQYFVKLSTMVHTLSRLLWFSPFENIFSIQDLGGNNFFLKNTELQVFIEEKKLYIFENGEDKWAVEPINVCNYIDIDLRINNKFFFKLTMTKKNEVLQSKYLFISAAVQNFDAFDEFKDTVYLKYKIQIAKILTWKQKFLKTRGNTSMLPGRKSGSIICTEPTELVSNPFLFHQFIKYSFIYFFDETYTKELINLHKKEKPSNLEKFPHLQLWYLYMRTVGINYKECISDLIQLNKVAYYEEEVVSFNVIKNHFLTKHFLERFDHSLLSSYNATFDLLFELNPPVPAIFSRVPYKDVYNSFEEIRKNSSDKEMWTHIIKTLQTISGNTLDTNRIGKQIEKLINIRDNNIEDNKRRVYELPMGFGKTSSLLPCIIYTCFRKLFEKGVVIVPFNLVNVVYSQLITFRLYFNNVVEILSSLTELRDKKTQNSSKVNICVCSDYDYKSFIVDNPSKQKLFDIIIVDEVDSLFDNVKTDFFKSTSFQRMSDVYDKVQTLEDILKDLKREYHLNEKLKYFKLPAEGEIKEFLKKDNKYEYVSSNDWFNSFIKVIVVVNAMRYELHYGLAKDKKRLFAVPYLNAKTPSPTNQFSDPNMVFILTYLSYLYCDDKDTDFFYAVDQYNLNQSIKDSFGRSKIASDGRGNITDFTDRYYVATRLVMFIFESDFEYSSEMSYTSMIDATSSFYSKNFIGFSGTIEVVDFSDKTKNVSTMIKYKDLNNEVLDSVVYDYGEYTKCKSDILNKQLCFLEKIEFIKEGDVSPKAPKNINIIYLDIGDVYLYEKDDEKIKMDIVKNCCQDQSYKFYKFKDGKLLKSSDNKNLTPSIYFYDHVNCRGTDYKFPIGEAYSIVTSISLRKVGDKVKTDNTLSEFLQALYRVRQLNTYFDNANKIFISKKETITIHSMYIYFINDKDITYPENSKAVFDLLRQSEAEIFEERKTYANEQYIRYLLKHTEQDISKIREKINFNQNIIQFEGGIKQKDGVTDLVLKLKDINHLKSTSDGQNKNQLQNKNNLEIPKNGDSTPFNIVFEVPKIEDIQNLPEKKSNNLYSLSLYHRFTDNKIILRSIMISLYSEKRTIKLSNTDLMYFYITDTITNMEIFILPFVFLNVLKTYAGKVSKCLIIYNMFGEKVASYTPPQKDNKKKCTNYNVISHIIRLFNFLIPYKFKKEPLKYFLQDKYLFQLLSNIDYLYPFNMFVSPGKDEAIYDEGKIDVIFPLKPLAFKTSFVSFKPIDIPTYTNEDNYFQYLTNKKTSKDTFFISEEQAKPYFEAFKYFTCTELVFEKFYQNFQNFKVIYDSRICLSSTSTNNEKCDEIKIFNQRRKCIIDSISDKSSEPIMSLGDKDLSFSDFTKQEWVKVIGNESKYNISLKSKALLVHLVNQFKLIEKDSEFSEFQCSKMSLLKTKVFDVTEILTRFKVENEEEETFLNGLSEKIETINKLMIEDVEKLPEELPKQRGDSESLLKIIKDLKTLKKLTSLQEKIVRFLYQFQVEVKFKDYYEAAFESIQDLEIDEIYESVKVLFPPFKFKSYGEDENPIESSFIKTFFGIKENNFNDLDKLLDYIQNKEMSYNIRNLIFKKFLNKMWKLICTKVVQTYNKLNSFKSNDEELIKSLVQINKYFEITNENFFSFKDVTFEKGVERKVLSENYNKNSNAISDKYKSIDNFLNKSSCEDMKEMLLSLLSKVTTKNSEKSSSFSVGYPSFPSIGNKDTKVLGLGAAATLGAIGLLHLNKKHKLTQKVKDYLQSRWSKKRVTTEDLEEGDGRQHHLKKNQDVVKYTPPQKSAQTKQPKQRQGNPKSSPKKTIGIKNPSVQKNTRKKLAQQ